MHVLLKSKFNLLLLFFCVGISIPSYGEDIPEGANSSSPTIAPSITGRPSIGPLSIVALPTNPGPSATGTPGRLQYSPAPLKMDQLKAFILTNPQRDVERISRFVIGTKEVCPKMKGYKGQSNSGKLLLSVCVLCYVLENGPASEYQALGISRDLSSNILNPEEKISVSVALATAIADFNTLSREIYVEQPELLERPTPFIKFLRENLTYLKNAEKKFNTSISQ